MPFKLLIEIFPLVKVSDMTMGVHADVAQSESVYSIRYDVPLVPVRFKELLVHNN